jgi:hypothetical protein
MKKQIFFLLMAFVVCQGLKAQNIGGLKYFNLVLPDNSLVSYELANGVDIHFQDSIMVVNDLNFCMEGGMKYYFSEGNEVGEEGGYDGSYIIGNKLYIKGPGKGSIAISDVMGRMVYSTAGCEECVVDLSSLAPNTLYVIRINNQSIKFLKR